MKPGRGPAPLRVRSEEEIAQAILEARAGGQRIRAVGSGGSKSQVRAVRDVALRLDQPDELLEVDGNTVTVPAGMTSGRLQELLQKEGLTLPTVGEWKNATVAGALATATHGGSAHHGIMSTSLRGVRVVAGTGETREITPRDADFEHVGVSLGALGIVSAVTLACQEHFRVKMETDVVSFDEYVGDPVGQESRTEFHASVWVPWARRVIRFGADRVPRGEGPAPRRERFGRWTAMATFIARRLGFHGLLSNKLFARTSVGDCADILSPLEVPPRVARFRNAANEIRKRHAAELAVPAARAGEVLARFDAFFQKRSGPLNNPVGLRMSAEDDFSLSPCWGRDTLWLDIFYDQDEAFVEGLASLARELEGRCHWGKAMVLSPEALRPRYPRWEAFRDARARLDPDQVFANAFTDTLGLTEPGPEEKPG